MKCKTIMENVVSKDSASKFDDKVNGFIKELDDDGYLILDTQFQHTRSSLSVSIIYDDDIEDIQ